MVLLLLRDLKLKIGLCVMATLRECGCCGQPVTKGCDPDCEAGGNLKDIRYERGKELNAYLRQTRGVFQDFKRTLCADLADLVGPHCANFEMLDPKIKDLGLYFNLVIIYKEDAVLGSIDRQVEDLFAQYGLQRKQLHETRTSTSWEFLMKFGDFY